MTGVSGRSIMTGQQGTDKKVIFDEMVSMRYILYIEKRCGRFCS